MKKPITLIIGLVVFIAIAIGFRSSVVQDFIFQPSSHFPVSTTDPNNRRAIVFTKYKTKEPNFQAEYTKVNEKSVLAQITNSYVRSQVSQFKDQADNDVPDLRKKFGEPHYNLIINASYIQGDLTHSVVLSEYRYTGGANGMSTYKTFTVKRDGNLPVKIGDIIPSENEEPLLKIVKDSLLEISGEDGISKVDQEAVDKLTFSSLDDWAIGTDSMYFYFDKYEVASGAVGPVEVEIPLLKVDYLFEI